MIDGHVHTGGDIGTAHGVVDVGNGTSGRNSVEILIESEDFGSSVGKGYEADVGLLKDEILRIFQNFFGGFRFSTNYFGISRFFIEIFRILWLF